MSLLNEIRFAVDAACRWKPAKRAGTRLYWWAAAATAKRWLHLPGVRSVALRGGMLRDCRPAISDLDFTIVLGDCDAATELDWTRGVLGEATRLKRAFPMLGELTLTTRERWANFVSFSPGPLVWYRDQLEFRDGVWAPLHTEGTPHVSARFALALDHFKLALVALQVGRSRYDAIVAEKELKKAGSYAGLTHSSDGLSVYLALDRLAQEALSAEFPSADVSWPEASPLAKPVEALLGEWRIRQLLKRPGFSVGATRGETPCSIVLTPAAAAVWVPALLRRETKARTVALFPFSPAMAECRARGWSGWWPTEALAQFSAQGAPPAEIRGHLLRNLCERLCHDSVSLAPARLLQTKNSSAAHWARRFETETNALRRMLDLPVDKTRSPDPLEQSLLLARSANEAVQAAREKIFAWRGAKPSVIVSHSSNDFQFAPEAQGPRTLPNQ